MMELFPSSKYFTRRIPVQKPPLWPVNPPEHLVPREEISGASMVTDLVDGQILQRHPEDGAVQRVHHGAAVHYVA